LDKRKSTSNYVFSFGTASTSWKSKLQDETIQSSAKAECNVVNKAHSYWFAQLKNYSKLLQEDREMHNCIEIYVRKHVRNSSNYGGMACIEIKRKTNLIQVEINTGFLAYW